MAARQYHINPTTGAVGKCSARIRCPFGEDTHYESLEEALASYERIAENFSANAVASKRGKSKESFSDAKNGFHRAALDRVLGSDASLIESWRAVVIQFHGCCYLCGIRVYDDEGKQIPGSEIQADHIVPPKRGGTISAGNMAPAHRWCNDDKGDTEVGEYLMSKGRPDLLKLVRGFQQSFNYEPPATEVVDEVMEELAAIWEEAQNKAIALRAKYQPML